MNDLDHLLAELPVEPAPLDELVVRGHHLHLRRRFVGAAVVGAVVVVAGGIALLGGSSSPGGRAVDPAADRPPVVRVVGTASPDFERLYAELDGAEPFWEAETEAVYYVSPPSFSSSCPPVGRVTEVDGAMTLALEADPSIPSTQPCTADAGPVIAVVENVPSKPDELTISDLSTQLTLPLHEGHPVVVRTELVGPEVVYIEGARVQTSVVTEAGVERSNVTEVGAMTTFRGVPEGRATVQGATLVCTGGCDSLAEPSDTCSAPLEVAGSTDAVVTVRWGSRCEVESP